MTHAVQDFEFLVTLNRPLVEGAGTLQMKVLARTEEEARGKASVTANQASGYSSAVWVVVSVECSVPRWRREIGHMISSECEVQFRSENAFVQLRWGPLDRPTYKGIQVETPYAVILVGNHSHPAQEVLASVSKTKREAMFWGIFADRKYGHRRGVGIVWLSQQSHLVGKPGLVKPDARSTRLVSGAEIYHQAVTGETYEEMLHRRAG